MKTRFYLNKSILIFGLILGLGVTAEAASCVRVLKTSKATLVEELIEGAQLMKRPNQSLKRQVANDEESGQTPPPPDLQTMPLPSESTDSAPAPEPSARDNSPAPPLSPKSSTPLPVGSQDSGVTETPVSSDISETPLSTDMTETPITNEVTETPVKPKEPEFIWIRGGQIFASSGVDATGQFVKIKVDRKEYLVPTEVTASMKLTGCFEQPVCLIAKKNSDAIKNLANPEEKKVAFKRNDKIQAVSSRINQKKERSYLVYLNQDYFWAKSKDVAVYTNKTCDEVRGVILPDSMDEEETVVQASKPQDDKYSFGFEVGYGMGYSSKDYAPFVTDVPDPSNVGPLSNPIITEVKKGKGLYLGPLLEVQVSDRFKLKFGALYQEQSFQYVGKSNPTIASNSLDSLPDVDGTVKNQSLIFSFAPAYEFGGEVHRFGLGVQLRTNYYISKPSQITYRTGSVFKATEVTVEAGPKGFETLGLANAYYQWRMNKDSHFRIRTTLESDGKVFNLGLSLFY